MFGRSTKSLARAQILMGEKPSYSQKKERESINEDVRDSEGWIDELCYHSNMTSLELKRLLLFVVTTSLSFLALAFFYRAYLFPILILPSGIAFLIITRRAFKRAECFERDYPAFLLSLASSIRTGLDPLSAIIESEKLFEVNSEIRNELMKFKLAIEHGTSEQQAIQEFAASIKHPDIQLFRTGYLLARREGSSLAECLQRLARVTRQRQSFRRKVRSAVAMQKLSAFGIGACAVIICLIQSLGNPKIISDALAHPLGQRLLISGFALIVIGLIWMLRMTRSSI